MAKEIAVSVKNVSKDFRLPHEKMDSVKSLFVNPFAHRGKKVETQHALKNISFEIPKGEFFGIVGRNGSGKSTLLKIIADIYQPNKGSIVVDGKLVPFIELGVGFNPELTGRENVYLNGALLGFSEKEIDKMYDDIVEFAELERFMDQKLKNYSSGMQVRLAFSVATRSNTDILVVDEVLAVGDADFQAKCFSFFKELKSNNKTVIFVTHDMNAVREYCDRAILIDHNEVILEGNAEKIASAYAKLFFEEEVRTETRQARWGNEKVVIKSVDITPSRPAASDKELTVSLTIEARDDVDNPVAGFMIKNQAAQPVLGTNTHIEQAKIGAIKLGDTRTITWTVPHIFARGVHYIDPSIIEYGTSEVYDWWEEAVSFVVHKDKVTPYIVNPTFKTHIR